MNDRPGADTAREILVIRLGGVNCYLATVDGGFVLIDTGTPKKRARLEAALEQAGCRPGNLKLVALTHGDYDHAGNAAYLRDTYGAEIGMHRDDSERVERADWRLGMKPKPDRFALIFRLLSPLALRVINSSGFDTFKPGVYLEDGQSALRPRRRRPSSRRAHMGLDRDPDGRGRPLLRRFDEQHGQAELALLNQ